MKKLLAVGILALCVLFLAVMAYLAVAAPSAACEFGPCVVKAK